MEGHCSTGQSPQWAVVPMAEEENDDDDDEEEENDDVDEEEEEEECKFYIIKDYICAFVGVLVK